MQPLMHAALPASRPASAPPAAPTCTPICTPQETAASALGASEDEQLAWALRQSLLEPRAAAAAMAGLAVAPPQHSRLTPALEEISALPKLKLQNLKPTRSCADELRRPELRAVVADMDDLLTDVGFKVDQLKFESLPVALPDDELFAVVVYTYNNQSVEQDGNLYYELNKSLRERSTQGRTALLQLWGGFLYYLLSGLAKLTDTTGVVYRGYPDKVKVQEQYKMGRPIQWGAFSSTSTDVAAAKLFTDKHDGVMFKVTVLSGKVIQAYSYFPSEDEVLISPQARFVVSSALYVGADGYTYLDMVEQDGTLFIS